MWYQDWEKKSSLIPSQIFSLYVEDEGEGEKEEEEGGGGKRGREEGEEKEEKKGEEKGGGGMDFKDTAPKRTKWKLKIYLSSIERKYRRYSGM